MTEQLALTIQLNDSYTLNDFCWDENLLLHAELQAIFENTNNERQLYLWGQPGCGKSHLLQACCQLHESSLYLPLPLLKEFGPDVLEGMSDQTIICIDDIDAIASDAAWEEALFHFYNRVRDQERGLLIISAKTPPPSLSIKLPDLKSRLSWGLVFQIHELSDDAKIRSLKTHAEKRGLRLSEPVLQFLLKRCGRNMHELHGLLNQLDHASWQRKRKITIPFIKETLNM